MRSVSGSFLALFVMIVCVPLVSHAQVETRRSAQAGYALVISDRESGKVAEIPLPSGKFDHVFVHSYHLTPVVERFEIKESTEGKPILHLYELDYESCGVGMPSETELGFSLVDGVFILRMSRDFGTIPLLVSIVEGHGLRVDGTFYPFTEWAPPESLLILSAVAAF